LNSALLDGHGGLQHLPAAHGQTPDRDPEIHAIRQALDCHDSNNVVATEELGVSLKNV